MPESTDFMNPTPELVPLANALKALEPATTAISRDRLLYEAGRAAAAPKLLWLWRTGTVVFAGLSVVLCAVLVSLDHRPPEIVERERIVEVRVPVEVPVPIPAPSPAPTVNEFVKADVSPSPDAVHMLHVRNDVIRWGVDMLPAPRSGGNPPPLNRSDDLDRWLGVPLGTFAVPNQKPKLFRSILGDG